MNDTQLAHLAVLTALNKMMSGSYFDICTIDKAIKALSAMPDGAAYKVLSQLHCVHWVDMPIELRDAVPQLIERCLSVPAYQFQITPVGPRERLQVLTGSVRLLTRGAI